VGRHLSNQLLARLDKATFAAIEPELSIVRLELGHVISETHSEVHTVYFPLNGVISCVVELIGGGAIETGMIGKDGQFGAAAALDHHVSLNHVVMQVSGEVLAIEASRFRYLIEQHPSLRKTTVAYDQFFLAQVQQTSACNAVHKVEARPADQRVSGGGRPATGRHDHLLPRTDPNYRSCHDPAHGL
jgi:CRP-like cAMP-binding protein